MSKHSASLIARKLGLKSYGNVAYGLEGHIFVSIYNEAFTGAVIANVGVLSSAQINQILDYLEGNKKRLCIKDSSYDKPYVTVRLDSHFSALCTKMYAVFKGKQGRPMILIIVFMLIVFTAAGVFSSWFVRALTLGNSNMNSIMAYMFDDMTITGIFGDMILGVFLAGLGAFAVIRGVIRTASGTGLKATRLPC